MNLNFDLAFSWAEIDQAPEGPGVYGWYSKLVIANADVEAAINRIETSKTHGHIQARAEVDAILNQFVFNPYKESPYKVQLRGQLKPRFGGEIPHEPKKSDSLIDRLVENPARFRKIAEILASAAPGFTAPLYIGMAINLRARLRQHKSRIVDLRETRFNGDQNDETIEAGFANQIAARGFDPTNLFVLVAEVKIETGEQNDIENILNRINYPIFGRN